MLEKINKPNDIHKIALADFPQLADEIRDLNDILGIPAALGEVGVKAEAIPAMAADAMKSGNIAVNPRSSKLEDIEMLYRKAM